MNSSCKKFVWIPLSSSRWEGQQATNGKSWRNLTPHTLSNLSSDVVQEFPFFRELLIVCLFSCKLGRSIVLLTKSTSVIKERNELNDVMTSIACRVDRATPSDTLGFKVYVQLKNENSSMQSPKKSQILWSIMNLPLYLTLLGINVRKIELFKDMIPNWW